MDPNRFQCMLLRLGRFLENPKIDDIKSRKSRFKTKNPILALYSENHGWPIKSLWWFVSVTHFIEKT